MDYDKAQKPPADTPRKALLVAALGLDYMRVTDAELQVGHHGNVVIIRYEGIVMMTPEEFAVAASFAIPPTIQPVEERGD